MSSEDQIPEDLKKQNEKFSYKAPETVYKKWTPKESMTASGKAFQGASPMDFYLRQNAAKKAEKAKEQETKTGLYKNQLLKGAFE